MSLYGNLQNSFGQIAIILFRDLGFVSRSVKYGWVIVYIVHVNDDGGIVLI